MNHADLCSHFVSGDTDGKASSMFIDGEVLYSYGYHFKLAMRLMHGEFLYNPDYYSSSTCKHQCRIKQALQYDTYWDCPDCDVEQMPGYLEGRIEELIRKIPRARQGLGFTGLNLICF